MNLTTKLGWAAFLVSLSALGISPAEATVKTTVTPQSQSNNSVEARLERIASVLKTNESQSPETSKSPDNNEIARGAWGNGYGRGWVNGNRWRNGGWRNNGWHNGNWRNGGGWLNR